MKIITVERFHSKTANKNKFQLYRCQTSSVISVDGDLFYPNNLIVVTVGSFSRLTTVYIQCKSLMGEQMQKGFLRNASGMWLKSIRELIDNCLYWYV